MYNSQVSIFKAYIEGKEIEVKCKVRPDYWLYTSNPQFLLGSVYRVKPEEPKELVIYIHRHKKLGKLVSSQYSYNNNAWELVDSIKHTVQ